VTLVSDLVDEDFHSKKASFRTLPPLLAGVDRPGDHKLVADPNHGYVDPSTRKRPSRALQPCRTRHEWNLTTRDPRGHAEIRLIPIMKASWHRATPFYAATEAEFLSRRRRNQRFDEQSSSRSIYRTAHEKSDTDFRRNWLATRATSGRQGATSPCNPIDTQQEHRAKIFPP